MRSFALALCTTAALGAALLLAPEPAAADEPDVCGDPPSSSRFDDVRGSIHEQTIICLDGHGIVSGVDDRHYDPSSLVTRAQMAAFIARTLERANVSLSDDHPGFSDTDGNPHEPNIIQLAAEGVITGVDEDRFVPAGGARRDQVAAFLARSVKTGTGDALPAGERTFTDIDDSVHRDAIDAAAAAELVRGVTDDRYDPDRVVSRDRMASFLTRLLQELADAGQPVEEPDYEGTEEQPPEEEEEAEEPSAEEDDGAEEPSYTFEGEASWYGPGFEGNQTACGETFDPNAMTAAHRSLPCGTEVRVTNLGNGRQVTVRINDRGPYAENRVIDVSERAAEELGFRDAGTAQVRGEVYE